MPISGKLIDEIEQKMIKIQASDSPEYFLKRSQRIKKDLRRICDVYSFWLENPDLRMKILNVNHETDPRRLRKIAREGVSNIRMAWDYLHAKQFGDSFIKYINSDMILEVGKLVQPQQNAKGFREKRVSLGLDYTPPNPLKVPLLVENACYELRESDYHPVEAAAIIHLDLAGIQPFIDGNKRTARLFQDRILTDAGLPPAVIPVGEREAYIDLIEQALIGKRDRNLKLQRPFFDYIGGKVNVALDEIIGDLRIRA